MTQPRPYETLKPPPAETLAVSYLTPLMTPLKILTRIPPNEPGSDKIPANTFIRIEASSGSISSSNSILFNVHHVVLSYAPYDDEVTAEDNIGTALAWMGNAQGTTITDHTGYEWYVTYSQIVSLGHRLAYGETPLVRYTGATMWRIAGQPIS